jgi:hypothetical protein
MNKTDQANTGTWPPQTQEDIDTELQRLSTLKGETNASFFHAGKFRTWNKAEQRVEVKSQRELFGDLFYRGTVYCTPADAVQQVNTIFDFIHVAEGLGQEVLSGGYLEAGEMFIEKGVPVEVRLRGRIAPTEEDEENEISDFSERMPWDENWESYPAWSTPNPPRFSKVGRDLLVAPEDRERAYITFLRVPEAYEPPSGYPEEKPRGGMIVTFNLREPWPETPERADKPKTPAPLRVASFAIQTSQEMDAWHRAQCAGKTFAGYSIFDQAGAIVHKVSGFPHEIRLALTDEERINGLAMSYLESLVRAQDADAALATAYILGVLAPPSPLPARALASGWIDFDDVLKKIGWYPQTTRERRAMHARIWEFVRFGERAQIVGKRTTKYNNPSTGEEIDTTIHGAIWRIFKTETPNKRMPGASPEIPVRAEIAVSKELTELLTSPKTAQYLHGAEILGAIAGGKPAGAWARVIGLALASFWRRNPRESISGTIRPTRRELLDHYAAKVAPYEEILTSDKPGRVIEYWCGALQVLADAGFIERGGEAAISAKAMRAALPRQNWKDAWLDQTINIEPSETMKPRINGRAEALPPLKPRDLKKKPRAKKRTKAN